MAAEPEPRPAPHAQRPRGRVLGSVAVFLGALAVLSVLCFHFPAWLTTPRLRAVYDVETLRWMLRGGMALGVVLGTLAFFRGARRLGGTGLLLLLVAQWMGGASVTVDDFDSPVVSFGLDWLVLALFANTVAFVFIERLFPHRREQKILRSEWRLDLVYYAVNHLLISVILLVTTFFSEGLFGWAVHDGFQALVRSQPVWLQFIEVMLVADLVQYAGHRLMHEHPRLWAFHAVHHCPAEMDWLSGSRIHFLEVLFTRSTIILPLFLLGFSEAATGAYVVWVGIQGVFIHSNVGLSFGPLRHLFVTPHFHHWHHSADAAAIDRNYAANLSFLDRLFGTYVDVGPDQWPENYGVVGKPLPSSFLGQHLYPFVAPPKGAEPAE
ncbi:MAG: sterol desaturase family protein [Myxococcota bacterium]